MAAITARLALKCAEAGKHVVCTKPLARNRHEAKEMLDAVRAAGVLHGYAETEVFSAPAPDFVTASEPVNLGAKE